MRILVIDDEVEVADLLAHAVSSEGHEAMVAHDGEEGLAALGRYRPDAVFLDVAMPGMTGIEVLRSIRATDPALPVVLITGRADRDDIEEARRLGVSEVIEKPDVLRNLAEAFSALRTHQG
jgi:two-component system OmpR family response regulator